ncbi:Hpt domain-containing protein [Novosphingobium mangrovi (ex Huang et al. 2023)]|uniref:Hpt domain-containing protein n=1 Tax=Novosphingobium mangrovi (ex Huang et al. 2023) TaxID=2976432 RepID=A0ABT2I3X3_9SPHN|nr:Hpt domain-containing protein [Novosphingobium mangrovi (ex Huang et al. 2023)]MCT2399510.1 Hpt domain-containing protein [Novosphingobium mangrovi (ex Huang et al. 2023)]
MAYEAGALEETIAAAAGGDSNLFAELRASYIESVGKQVDLLERSRCDGNWHLAAMRLKGLAASFHSAPLLVLAEQALDTAPGDPAVVRQLKAYVAEFSAV